MAYANRRRTYREGYRAGERGTIALSARALWLPDKQRAMPLTDAAFHLDEGRTLHGSVSWTEATQLGRARATHQSAWRGRIRSSGTATARWRRRTARSANSAGWWSSQPTSESSRKVS